MVGAVVEPERAPEPGSILTNCLTNPSPYGVPTDAFGDIATPGPRRPSGFRAPATIGFSLYGLAYLIASLGPWSDPAWVSVITNAGLLPVAFGAVMLAQRASRCGRRRPWALLSLAFLCYAAGDFAWFVLEDLQGLDPSFSWANLFYLAYYPLALAAMLAFSSAPCTGIDALKFALDCITVTVAGAMLILCLAMDPMLQNIQGAATGLEVLVTVLQPVGDILLVLGAASVLLRLPSGAGRNVLVLLSVAMLINAFADSLWIYQAYQGDYATGGVSDSLWLIGYLFAIASAETERGRATEIMACARKSHEAQGSGFYYLPYLAIAVAYSLLLYAGLTASGPLPITLILGVIAIAATVACRQAIAIRAVREHDLRFGALVEHSSDAILITDREGIIHYASPSVTKVLGSEPKALEGRRLVDSLHPDDRSACGVSRTQLLLEPGATATSEWRFQHAQGTWLRLESVLTNLVTNPAVGGIVINMRDVTERAELQNQLYLKAYHDQLTGLANRTLFFDRVSQALARMARTGRTVALLFCDLDRFKVINDSLGHAHGDHLLVEAAGRIGTCVRQSDTAARLGGDEFGVLLEDVIDPGEVLRVADRLIKAFETPFRLELQEVTTTTSIGIAIADGHESAKEMIRNADLAMYSAKARGRGCFDLYKPEMYRSARERLELQQDLHHALTDKAFTLQYQPIMRVSDGRVYATEALIRWRGAGGQMIPPQKFIGIAEESGLIVPIGRWVLDEALQHACRWHLQISLRGRPAMTINLSGRQVRSHGLIADISRALERSQFPADQLVVELTETTLMDNTDIALRLLNSLKRLGVSIAIDDFGTGYSCLAYLHKYPIDIIKIPMEFVAELGRGPAARNLVGAIIAMGRGLGMATVAEGVELSEQVEMLAELGCDLMQGYYFGRPMPAAEMISFLLDQPTETVPTDSA